MGNQLTISDAGSLLMGAGLAKLDSSLGLILIGIGALLKIIVAILQKNDIQVQSNRG